MDYQKTASDIVKYAGGKENIQNLTHCFTRLRFVLKDDKRANKDKLSQTEGVISVVYSGGELQVVCGAKVEQIFEAVMEEIDGVPKAVSQAPKKKSLKEQGNHILQVISQIFTPLVPAIAATGLIKGLLTAVKLIMDQNGVDISGSDTYVILYAVSQVIFYFFPIFLAYTTAKALHCNEVVAMVLGGTLVYPAIDTIVQDVDVKTTLFGLPVVKHAWEIGDSIKVFSYAESVIPILLIVFVMAYLERFLKRFIPEILQIILVPGLELIIMLPIAFSILGPIGIYIGNGIQVLYDGLIGISPVLGGGLIGGLWGVFVIFGAHRALIPIGLNDVAMNGKQNILAFAGAANFAQAGAALGVFLKTKKTTLKQVAASGTIAAGVVGITEPAIYGCNLRLKKPMVCAIISGAIGGAVMGAGGVYGDAFANNGVLTIFTYAAFGMIKFMFYLVGILIAFFGAAALTYVIGFDDKNMEQSESEKVTDILKIEAPIQGKAIPLAKVTDEVFASEELGKGVAIVPSEGVVRAPSDCTVSVIYTTMHAIGLTLDNGVELLIHIGIDTVHLKGKYFTQHVKVNSHIQKGTEIVSFDIAKIKKEGYDITTPVIVSNTSDYSEVEAEYGVASFDSIILYVNEK